MILYLCGPCGPGHNRPRLYRDTQEVEGDDGKRGRSAEVGKKA